MAIAKVYTLNADFDEGTLVNVNHTAVADQLQLNSLATTRPFSFIHVPCSFRGTIVRINTNTGTIVGEYKTAPTGQGANPSRMATDRFGNVYVGNRSATAGSKGSVVKIGIVIGGTRCDADGTPNATGDYLKDWAYTTATRTHNGLIKTSRGLTDIRPWITDTGEGTDGTVTGADDDLITLFKRAGSANTRYVAIDTDQSIWVAGHDGALGSSHVYEHLDSDTFETFSADTFDSGPSGGHGGHITTARVLWSSDIFGDDGSALTLDGYSLRRVLSSGSTLRPHLVNNHCITQDSTGRIWASGLTTDLYRVSADGGTIDTFSMGATTSEHGRTLVYNPVHDDIWVAHHTGDKVTRWSTSGVLQATIANVTDNPRGIGVDGDGKVWVTCQDSNNVHRIDPATNLIDLTIALGSSALPYGFTDYGGMIPFTVTQPSGIWHVVYDHGSSAQWGRVSWTEETPETCEFYVERRIASTLAGLMDQPWTLALNGVLFGREAGQFVEVRCTFLRPDQETDTPILFDLTLETLDAPVEPLTAPCASQIVQPRHKGTVTGAGAILGLASR